MVRALYAMPREGKGRLDRGGHARPFQDTARLVVGFALIVISGCAIVPRSRMDECQKLSQTLRGDNARLKDRILALQGQNRDYAERAVDDAGAWRFRMRRSNGSIIACKHTRMSGLVSKPHTSNLRQTWVLPSARPTASESRGVRERRAAKGLARRLPHGTPAPRQPRMGARRADPSGSSFVEEVLD